MEDEYWRTQQLMRDEYLAVIREVLDGPDLLGEKLQTLRERLLMVQGWLAQDRCIAQRGSSQAAPFTCTRA